MVDSISYGVIIEQASANNIVTPNDTGTDNVSFHLSMQNYSYKEKKKTGCKNLIKNFLFELNHPSSLINQYLYTFQSSNILIS